MQFDLRFYVVALLFIIFDVEVAFFFPWAVVFGKATQLADHPLLLRRLLPRRIGCHHHPHPAVEYRRRVAIGQRQRGSLQVLSSADHTQILIGIHDSSVNPPGSYIRQIIVCLRVL